MISKRYKKEFRDELQMFDVDRDLADKESKLEIFESSIRKNKSEMESNKAAAEDYEIKLEQTNRELEGVNLADIKIAQRERSATEIQLKQTQGSLKGHNAKKITLIREYSWVAFAHKLSDEALDFINEAELEGKSPSPF